MLSRLCVYYNFRISRASAGSYWLARLEAFLNLRPIFEEVVTILENRLVECSKNLVVKEGFHQLTCIDFEWDWREEEEFWTLSDRLLYAWISAEEVLLKFRTADLKVNEILYLDMCLGACQPVIRLRAFRLAGKLTKTLSIVSIIKLFTIIFSQEHLTKYTL